MTRKHFIGVLVVLVIWAGLAGCKTAPESTPSSSGSATLLKQFPDHGFDPKAYTRDMVKGGHRLLIWQDPKVDLSQFASVRIAPFGGRLLPAQNKFSYAPFIKQFNRSFQDTFKHQRGSGANTLRVVGEVVECNPGNRAARYLVGLGAGKAAGAVACEVYLPNRSTPCLKIYVRDTASHGMFGGDSVAYLNHIFSQVAMRLSTKLEELI